MASITEWLREHSIEEVEALVPDMAGTARGKFIPAERYSEEEGIRLAEQLFSQTVTGDYVWETEHVNPVDIDMRVLPDVDSLRLVPWAPCPTAQIIHDCYYANNSPVQIAPRYVLKRIINLIRKRGLQPVIAPEVEFYLVKPNTDADYPLEPPVGRSGRQQPARRLLSIDALNEFEDVIEDIYDFSEVQSLDIETLIHEDGVAQIEVNFVHGDPLNLADQVFLFKRTAREAAYRHGMYATFMAKPHQNQPGSAMHLHQSLLDRDTGKNMFANRRGKPTKLFLQYIAGLQRYMPAAMPLIAPNVNSYRRIARYDAAPINTHWGYDNRTVGLRVPLSPPEATRVENRMPGSDANPYLAIAATLAAGYLGVMDKLTPEEPLKTDAYDLPYGLPRDLLSALQLLKDCKPLSKLLGESFVELYSQVKALEYETFFHVISSWEREHLLLNV
ncbi:MAG: glutamine synthetase [Gammaproteobacteria bacterium]|nr:glutamine synthetase [Gammaproteobacteria bacterium]